MRDALNASGRAIYFSMCQWGQETPWVWAAPVGNSWRTTGDISGSFKSFTEILDKQIGLSRYAGPGAWNDPDMLEVGNAGMTNDEYQAHFALWAALKSPLLIGCSLSNISPQTLAILGNEEVIAVNQDSLGKQADLIMHETNSQVWGGVLSNNRFVYVCFNRGSSAQTFKLDFNTLLPSQKLVKIREIIDHQDVAVPADKVFHSKSVRSHAVAMYVVTYEN
jgi:alpha-galactosidase